MRRRFNDIQSNEVSRNFKNISASFADGSMRMQDMKAMGHYVIFCDIAFSRIQVSVKAIISSLRKRIVSSIIKDLLRVDLGLKRANSVDKGTLWTLG